MGPTRFERKIIAAMAVVAFVPFFAALLLGRTVLREAYQVGMNPRVRKELERGLETYRAHFQALRADAERVATATSRDQALVRAAESGESTNIALALRTLLSEYENVAELQLFSGEQQLASVRAHGRLDETRYRLLRLTRTVGTRGLRLDVTIATPAEPFYDYQRAGEMAQVFSQLERGSTYVSATYLLVYLAFLLSVSVIALALGIVVSRRVTRRITVLADATARVGAGDLSVSVPVEASDEVGELTRAFNDMVLDLRETRSRVAYLQRISAWQEFARRLAHEIKNPLTPIQLAVQEVERSYSGEDAAYRKKVREARNIVEEEVATLRRLVTEFSNFAKLPDARLEAADLTDFVRDSVKSMETAMTEDTGGAIDLKVESSGVRIPVKIDAMMLKRCLDNLVRNAAQAIVGQRGRVAPHGTVIVAARVEGTDAVLEVRDDGPGITAEDRARVFDAYFTTKTEGTGLGLAIVKKVVLEHGGEVSCDVAPEGGAAFRIRLPLYDPSRTRTRRSTVSHG